MVSNLQRTQGFNQKIGGRDWMPEKPEMHVMEALVCVHRAYKETGVLRFFFHMIRNAQWYSAFAVITCGIVAIITAMVNQDALPFISVPMALVFVWFQRDAYRKYKGDPALKLDVVANNNQGHRFVLFCENIPDELKKNNHLIEKLLRMLEQRRRVQKTNVITRNPIISIQLSILLMFVGATISEVADKSFEISIVGVFLLAGAFFITLPLNCVWRSREYRDEELAEFVLWLWAVGASRSKSTIDA